jgi:hypothetical protein
VKLIFNIIGALVLVGGIAAIGLALWTPHKYYLDGASAIQATQVYSEATYYAVIAVAAFVLAGVLLIATKDDGE